MIRTTINEHELGLVFRNDDLRRVLAPGRHLVRERFVGGSVQRVNRLVTRFDHPLLDVLATDPALRPHLIVVDLEQNQRAIVWRDGRLYDFVAAGRFAYWSAPYRVKVEVFEVDDQELGVAVSTVGIRDIVLPGEMKTILNQVIQAQQQAEANLSRRREQTAAARSQANTARLLADHPTLMRMKEIEALAAILRDARPPFVFGTGDLTTQVKSLIADGDGDWTERLERPRVRMARDRSATTARDQAGTGDTRGDRVQSRPTHARPPIDPSARNRPRAHRQHCFRHRSGNRHGTGTTGTGHGCHQTDGRRHRLPLADPPVAREPLLSLPRRAQAEGRCPTGRSRPHDGDRRRGRGLAVGARHDQQR